MSWLRLAYASTLGALTGAWFTRGRPTPASTLPPAGASKRPDDLARRNDAILRSAMDGFFVVDEQMRFIEVNEAFCRMLGYRAEELLRMKMTDLEVEGVRGGPGTTDRTGLHQFVTAHRHRDGHIVHLENSVTVLRDGGGRILVGFARDVTERLRAQEQLRAANERFEAVVGQMPLGRIVWSADFRVLEWNRAAAEMYGWSRFEAVGRAGLALLTGRLGLDAPADPDLLKPIESMWANLAVDHPQPVSLTLTNIRRDGTPIRCEWFNTAVRGPDGGVAYVASLVRDVSEQERLQAELERVQRLESLGVMAGGVAHDFNNFLVGVLCNATLSLEKLDQRSAGEADDAIRQHLRSIVNASRRASELTRQMLAYSGRASFDVRPTALNALISDLGEFLRAALPRTVQLHLELADGLPDIHADAGQIQQVVMNLLLNAAEAIGDRPGNVRLITSQTRLNEPVPAQPVDGHALSPGDYVSLRVQDDGCGMSAETQSRIFDPFFTTKFTGRGLGLAAILGIVRGHRGAIQVESRPGAGTTFTVLLPAVAARVQPAPPAPDAPSRIPNGATVLVIDDDADIREVVESVLESRGARVLSAPDGRTGVEIFRRNAKDIDVVLLDMTMPGMRGDEVFHSLRHIREDACVILSSGYAEQEAVSRFVGAHPAGFVQKPYTIDRLVESIGAAMRRSATTGSVDHAI